MAINSAVTGQGTGGKLVRMCEGCSTNASWAGFSSSKWSVKGWTSAHCLKACWHVTCRVRWPATSCHSLCPCMPSWWCDSVRVWIRRWIACRSGFCRLFFFLTYILLSTMNSKEICVNQLLLWPACLLPLAGWLSRSADLIKTEETISSDFHFFESPPPQSWPCFGHVRKAELCLGKEGGGWAQRGHRLYCCALNSPLEVEFISRYWEVKLAKALKKMHWMHKHVFKTCVVDK